MINEIGQWKSGIFILCIQQLSQMHSVNGSTYCCTKGKRITCFFSHSFVSFYFCQQKGKKKKKAG